MAQLESDRDMVRRHVAEGEHHVALQQRIIGHIRDRGGSTTMAEDLLTAFEQTLGAHRAHLERLERVVE
ncbi:MAG: hypothetical protein H0V46_01905 [Sphingomonas sp.]|nr:hypothetical protein [Sphingomonas sp.]